MRRIEGMEYALIKDDTEKVKKLIEKYGMDMFCFKKYNGYFLYHWFVASNNVDLVTFLLDRGWDINQKDEEGNTALHYAIWNEFIEMFHLLIKRGIKIDEKGNDGETPFWNAMWIDNQEMAHALYKLGADVNVETNKGKIFDYLNNEYGCKYWISIFLQEPDRLNAENLRIVKAKRLEFLYK